MYVHLGAKELGCYDFLEIVETCRLYSSTILPSKALRWIYIYSFNHTGAIGVTDRELSVQPSYNYEV